jgi:molybdate transport system substrate-binding protein
LQDFLLNPGFSIPWRSTAEKPEDSSFFVFFTITQKVETLSQIKSIPMKSHAIPSFIILLISLVFIGSAQAGEVDIAVAASLTDACKQIISNFNGRYPDIIIRANYSSSGALAKQIVQGAPVDIYISANPQWMAFLIDKHRIAKGTVSTLAHNTLVVIGRPPISIASLGELGTLERIAIGSPQSVPAGQYARQAMREAHVYQDLLSGNKLVMVKDVRQALLYADRGEVDGAMVYKTDALMAEHAKILFSVPENLYDRITYPMALTTEGDKKKDAQIFHVFLQSPNAKAILKNFGFEVTD